MFLQIQRKMTAVTRVLLVDDEPALLESLSFVLARGGFEALEARSLAEAHAHLGQGKVDLIVLDLTLPDGDGLSLLDSLRTLGSLPPLIVLSSRSGEGDRVRALDSGADDYVTKPFSPREMVARIHAVLRRTGGELAEDARADAPPALLVEAKTRRVSVLSRPLDLTRAEFDILALLETEPGHVFSRARIIDAIWGSGFALSDRTIDSHVKALRRKIVEAGGGSTWIETVRGVGYRLSDNFNSGADGS
jgi:DNA-binding response OmpR family regulator